MNGEAATPEVEHLDDVVVVKVSGDLTRQPSRTIEKAVIAVLDEGAARVVLDLSAATGMDSATVGNVAGTFIEAQQRGATLVFVLKLLQGPSVSTGHPHPDNPLRIYESREQAIRSLQDSEF
jgi:anti-anti-sigma factor